jgi:hypothetical protein
VNANERDGLRALHYVQDEIRRLSNTDGLTREGRHALLCYRNMLREVWGKEYAGGTFVFIAKDPTEADEDPAA